MPAEPAPPEATYVVLPEFRKPLQAALADISGTDIRTAFWSAATIDHLTAANDRMRAAAPLPPNIPSDVVAVVAAGRRLITAVDAAGLDRSFFVGRFSDILPALETLATQIASVDAVGDRPVIA